MERPLFGAISPYSLKNSVQFDYGTCLEGRLELEAAVGMFVVSFIEVATDHGVGATVLDPLTQQDELTRRVREVTVDDVTVIVTEVVVRLVGDHRRDDRLRSEVRRPGQLGDGDRQVVVNQ